MKVLVTGADGFIGSHLVEALLLQGYQVRALAQYNAFNHWGWLENIAPHSAIDVVCGDIRDAEFCHGLCEGMDWVFHLAALIAIPFSYRAPASYVATNVQGSLNLFQSSLKAGVSKFVHTSTSEIYGTAQYTPIDERHPIQAQSPYSASKIAADALAMSFYYSYDLPIVIARPFNTYGPRQSARAFIPSVITQVAKGVDPLKLGDLSPTRDLNYVSDTCRAFIQLANCDEAIGKSVNIGSGRETFMAETLDIILRLMNSQASVQTDQQRLRPRKSEVKRLVCDNSELKRLTAFDPMVSLELGLQQTIDWFSCPENLRHYKGETYNV